MESFSRTNDSKWLSQFGLYRYQSADSKKSKYHQISFIIYGIFGVASIVIFATFFVIIVQSNLQDKTIIVTNPQLPINNSYNNGYNLTLDLTQNDDTIIRDDQLEPLHKDDEHEYLFAHNKNDTAIYDSDGDDLEARNGTNFDFDEYDSAESSGDTATVEDLEKISAEKLTLVESDYSRAPPMRRRQKKRRQKANRRQFDTRVTYYEPRPFDFELNGPTPASFQKQNYTNPGMTTYTIPGSQVRVNSIQDILNQGEVMSDTHNEKPNDMNRIQFTGTYRHPKRYNELMGIFSQNYPRNPLTLPTGYPTADYYPSSSTQFSSDPFYKYKPRTPSEINLMALNQFRFAPYGPKAPLISSSSSIVPSAEPMLPMKPPTYQPPVYSPYPPTKYLYPINPSQPPPPPPQPSEYENIYHALLKTNHASSIGSSSRSSNRNSDKRVYGRPKKSKPFSLMLDIYPMTDDESISSGLTSTKRPAYRFRRPAQQQLPIYPHGYFNQYGPAVGDQSYFNSINFPQLQQQQRYQTNLLNAHYFQSKHRNNNNNYNNNQHEDADPGGYEKPGQMVVHLNLFPKGNRNRNTHKNHEYLEERSSEEPNDSNYDGTYDFQPRSLNSDISADIFTPAMSLNTGEMLTTTSPPLATTSKSIEIIRSIEWNATNWINFDNVTTNQNLTNLTTNPIVVVPNLRVQLPTRRSDDYDSSELEFIDHKLSSVIPRNHKIDNSTTRHTEAGLSNFTIDEVEVMRFEPKDVVMKQSERDYFAEHI